MLIYKYHAVTGELISKRSTLKPESPGENETAFTPPQCSGVEIPVFSNGSWTIVPDYRRVNLYLKATKQPIRLGLGVTPDNTVTNLKPAEDQVWNDATNSWVYPLAIQKRQKTAELFRLCDAKLDEVLSYYLQSEPDTWPEKTKMSELWMTKTDEERLAIVQNPLSVRIYGMLFAEAVGTYAPTVDQIGEITSLAGRILSNKIGFGIYAGMIMKIKTDTARLIMLASSEVELDNIPIDFSSVSLRAIMQALSR